VNGEPVGRVWSFHDITQRRQAEAEQQKLLANLERSNKELEQFAYVASHDLQEPLRLVSAYTELLLSRYRSKLDADADPLVNFITEGVTRMQRLIQDLLAYSRVSSRNIPLELASTEQALNVAIQNLTLAIYEHTAVVTHDPLPDLFCDETEMIQLFQNLIGNALKFRQPEVPLHVHVSVRQLEHNVWLFAVRDNGIGIEPEFFERIFIIFQRLHSRKKYSGTGIGLAICKRIVEHHGGRIWVESQKDQGTTFFFTIATQPPTAMI
jgi:light-regulated signal transduction histidine kinase (bacteriophytochrome)